MGRLISRSQYLMGLQCPKRLWLYKNRRALLPPQDEAARVQLASGAAVEALGRGLYPGGRLIQVGASAFRRAMADTARGIKKGSVLYGATVSAGGMFARCDILSPAPGGAWDLVDVTSALTAREEHVQGLAAQACALSAAGLKVRSALLARVNRDYVRATPVSPRDFFVAEDLTAPVMEAARLLPSALQGLDAELSSPEEPRTPIGERCLVPHECPFRAYCWKGLPPLSVFNLPRLSWEKRGALRLMGITAAADIPDTFELEPWQRRCVEAARTGRPVMDAAAIRAFLAGLSYPLYHIDFETVMSAIPLYDGTRPYQQVPFQVSLHVQPSPGAASSHFEHLASPAGDPRPGVADFLLSHIGPDGSLVAYNSPFEEARLMETARDLGGRASALAGFAARLRDLAAPFRDRAYVHPAFNGSYSLKKVLPVIAPELSYDGLSISGGAQAQFTFLAMAEGRLSPAEAGRAAAGLKEYCGRDTLAMVRILEELYRVSKEER